MQSAAIIEEEEEMHNIVPNALQVCAVPDGRSGDALERVE
jgi:hypothetical protein